MGPNKCRCKMPCPPPIPTTNPRKEIWIVNSEVARGMGPYPPEQESPHRDRIPAQMEYLRQREMDTAFIAPQRPEESVSKYRRPVYDVLLTLMQTQAQPIGVRVERLWPYTDWTVVWKNL